MNGIKRQRRYHSLGEASPLVAEAEPPQAGLQSPPFHASDMSAVIVERYQAAARGEWDGFVEGARNGTFLHLRDYLEYHADRFQDHSLILRDSRGVAAVLPANQRDDVLESHGGLTFGGLLVDDAMTLPRMLDAVDTLLLYLAGAGLRALRYRAVPLIYHRQPAQEDLYALARSGARLVHRAALSVLAPGRRLRPEERRRRGVRRATAAGLEVRESDDLEAYWAMLSGVLEERYDARPVHSLSEIILLRSRFPRNIRLFAAYRGGEMLAGVLVYESERVARMQYIASSESGRKVAALDLVFENLLSAVYREKEWIDLGTSEGDGRGGMNEGVQEFKESWGARTVAQDTYLISSSK